MQRHGKPILEFTAFVALHHNNGIPYLVINGEVINVYREEWQSTRFFDKLFDALKQNTIQTSGKGLLAAKRALVCWALAKEGGCNGVASVEP